MTIVNRLLLLLFCRLLMLLVAVAAVLVGVPPGSVVGGENSDPYGSDPLGLIARYDLTSELGTTADVFEVWTCEISGGSYGLPQVTADALVPVLGSIVEEYWSKASGGAYRVSFVVGGTVRDPAGDCWEAVRKQSSGGTRAALIAELNSHYSHFKGRVAGVGSPGRWCVGGRTTWWCDDTYPDNHRFALVRVGGGSQSVPIPSVMIHEMGHTLAFPHSYTGLLPEDDPLREYDNPMDIMSGGGTTQDAVGMIAVNRYAAGWIPSEQVHVYEGGTAQMTLRNWGSGTLMLAIPSDEQGLWLSVGARIADNYNAAPTDGVEVYVVDQRPTVCEQGKSKGVCWGYDRLAIPYPTDQNNPLSHVLVPGEQLTWNAATVTVVSGTDSGFVVKVTDGTDESGRFVDDDGNTHEPDIERIAQLGITVGCATDPPMFCPDRPVNRAEMAAFLVRALQVPAPDPTASTFGDVNIGVWYSKYVHAIAGMGIDNGADGIWRPTDPLTRREMAYWLVGAFPHINPSDNPAGLFPDVQLEDWHVVEGLYQAGVTKGCSTTSLSYCPNQSVTRGQMASFLVRSLP